MHSKENSCPSKYKFSTYSLITLHFNRRKTVVHQIPTYVVAKSCTNYYKLSNFESEADHLDLLFFFIGHFARLQKQV